MAAQRRDAPYPAPQRGHDQTFVVCATFDAATDAAIERLREDVEAAGHRVRRTHRPHFTLTAARVPAPDGVVAVAGEVAARHRPITVTLAGLGSFPSGVLFVAPDASPALRELQQDTYDTLRPHWPAAFGAQTEPANWVAHCTLATRLPPRALPTLRQRPFEPFPATVDAVAVIVVGGRGDVARLPLTGT